MPPPVLIGDASLIRALATDVPDAARELIAHHWPGPLTVICKIQPSLRMDLGDTDGTIALRVPDHEVAREILRRTGPMAVRLRPRDVRNPARRRREGVPVPGTYKDTNSRRDSTHMATQVSEKEARQVAEDAREQEWKLPSFGKELFMGNFQLDLIHPQPKLDPADDGEGREVPRRRCGRS